MSWARLVVHVAGTVPGTPARRWGVRSSLREKLSAVMRANGVAVAPLAPSSSEESLARTKQDFANSQREVLESPESLGLALTEAVSLGDWRLFFLQRDRVRAVTLADDGPTTRLRAHKRPWMSRTIRSRIVL